MEEKLPQLFMRMSEMDNIPAFSLPNGCTLHTHIEGNEGNWESIVERSFGYHFDFEKAIKLAGGYKPEYVFYIEKDGVDIATMTAATHPDFPNEGWCRVIATVPEARGIGAGKAVVLAGMNSLKERGYKSIALSTDDERIPAISLYLSLGFKPLITHESHEGRWKEVLGKLNMSVEALK